jgi:hypothetical protein
VSRCGVAVFVTFVLACAAALPAGAVTTSPTVRHLVYTFTWGTSSDTEVHTSGMPDSASGGGGTGGMAATAPATQGSASGIATYGGGADDKGTITVDVLRQQPDKGLVVNISEQAQNRRSAEVATCVVYGDTTVVCDPNKKINVEELTLLRLLGDGFVDPDKLDAGKHWQTQQQSASQSSTTDFTIAGNANGAMTIDETRVIKDTSGARPETSNLTGTIGYDFGRGLPTKIDEYTILHSEQGEQYETIKTQTVMLLQSDSSAKP